MGNPFEQIEIRLSGIESLLAEIINQKPTVKKEEPAYLNIDEVSALLGISKQNIYRMTHLRQIPFYKAGKHLRFKRSEVIGWLELTEQLTEAETQERALKSLTKKFRNGS